MWLFVYFDLPVETKDQRRAYTAFRKGLLKDGFSMIQYSIYARHCASIENAEVHRRRAKAAIPRDGEVILFIMTDKQFGQMEFYKSSGAVNRPNTPQQLELF